MIGVDIIDKKKSYSSSKHSFEALSNKILSASEQLFCTTSNDLNILWAIKESAYKAWSVMHSKEFINPKRIKVISFNDVTGEASVAIEQNVFNCRVTETVEYIYAIATIQTLWPSIVIYIEEVSPQRPVNERTHFFGKGSMQSSYLLASSGFPNGLRTGNQCYHYSRSHHGRFYLSAILAA